MRLWKLLEIAGQCETVDEVERRLKAETEISLPRDELLPLLYNYQMDFKPPLRAELERLMG